MYWSTFYHIPLNDERFLSLSEEELLRDVQAIQWMQDPVKLAQHLSGKTVFVDTSQIDGAENADAEMTKEEVDALVESQKETDEMDAALEKIFGTSL